MTHTEKLPEHISSLAFGLNHVKMIESRGWFVFLETSNASEPRPALPSRLVSCPAPSEQI